MVPRFLLLFVGILFLAAAGASGQGPNPKFTPEQEAKFKEWQRLAIEANKLIAAGKQADAIEIGHKMLAITRELYGKDHERVVASLDIMAGQYQVIGNHAAAIQTYEEAVAIRTRLYGADDWRTTDCKLLLGDLRLTAKLTPEQNRRVKEANEWNEQGIRLLQQAEYTRALDLFQKAFETYRELFGETHWQALRIGQSISQAYQELGDYTRAERFARLSVEHLGKAMGEKHPGYAAALTVLARVHWGQRDFARAEPAARQASAIYRECFGPNHAKYAQSLHNLATLYSDQNERAKAEVMYRQALEIRRKAIGEKNPEDAANVHNLAGLYLEMGKLAKAEPLDQDRFGRDGFLGHHPGLLSGLVLAEANTPARPDRDDGILTALEVADLDLRAVNLVVMSACETGLGATAGGEGVLGLQQAFQAAGARSVVAGLWKVEDQATAALMGLFYHKLWRENKSPVVALREAQLTVYQNPERIPRLAKGRGPDFEAVAKLPTTPAKELKPGARAPVKLWAAFVLSGAGQ